MTPKRETALASPKKEFGKFLKARNFHYELCYTGNFVDNLLKLFNEAAYKGKNKKSTTFNN